ncbi:MAG: TlpA disulfide reductase family protein [Myxococcota bacterium]
MRDDEVQGLEGTKEAWTMKLHDCGVFGISITKRLAGSAVAALLVLAPVGARGADEGDPAPAFSASKLGGEGNISLSSYRGKVVYLDFWASWCAPCQAALPALEELRKEFPADQFQVIAVNVDTDPEKALRLLAKHKIGYPSAADPSGRLPETFGLKTMPTSYLIDRSGVVRMVHPGFRSSDVETLRARIKSLVEAKK